MRRAAYVSTVWVSLAGITAVFWRLAVTASWPHAASAGIAIALVAGVLDRVWDPAARPRLPAARRPAVLWPYRPREGYPSAPVWLFVVVLAGSVVLVLLLDAALDGSIR